MPHNLLLTGRPGVGKTTLIRRVLDRLPPLQMAGFITAEIRGPHGRLGFRATTLDDQQIVLAHVDLPPRYRVSRYGVDVETFEQRIVPTLDPQQQTVELFVVDEIGKMEWFSTSFRRAVTALLEDRRPLLGTIALRGPAGIGRIRKRPDVELVEVTRANRDRLVDAIAARLTTWIDHRSEGA